MRQNRTIRGAILLGLSLLGIALVCLFLSGVSIAQATLPTESNSVSMGSASNVDTTFNPARAVVAIDLDQNDRPDLTFGQRGSLQSAENSCDVVFDDTGVVVGPLDPTHGMVIGDLDRDGNPDIVTDQQGDYLYARENDGTPFSPNWPSHNLGSSSSVVPQALADLDSDGYLDIVATRRYGDRRLQIWQNDGTPFDGEWSRHTVSVLPARASALAIGDLDGNNTPEIVIGLRSHDSVSPTIEIWRFEGDPFATTWISAEVAVVSYTVNSIALGDLDDDDRLDIVFGTEHAPPANPMPDVYQLRAAHNDGTPFDGGWALYDLGRDPQWSGLVPAHGFWGATIYSVDVADFDDDGCLDIATGEGYEGDHQVMVWENDGTPFDGEQWQPTTTGFGPGWDWESQSGDPWLSATVRSVVAADFNGDGLMDLVSGSEGAEPDEISYWENTGIPFGEFVTDTHWIRHYVGTVHENDNVDDVSLVDAADFDSDGDTDIASLANVATGNPAVHVWENKTAGCPAAVNVEANPTDIPADGISTSVVMATATDAYGNPVADGTVVTFTTTLGSFPAAPYTTATLGGVATATLTSATTVGTAEITAAVSITSDQTTVNFVVNSAADITVGANPTHIPADGISTSLVTATVKNTYGNPVVDGTVVTFTTTLGSFPAAPYATTTLGGVATATLTSGTTGGTAVVTAKAGTATGQTTVNFAGSHLTEVYLPLISKGSVRGVSAPDLVERIIVTDTVYSDRADSHASSSCARAGQ